MIFGKYSFFSISVLLFLDVITKVTSQCSLNGEVISYEGPCTYGVSASINLYTNANYTEQRSPPYFEQDSTKDIFVQLRLLSTERVGTNLLVEECYTTPNEDYLDSKPEYIIRKPGCPYSNFQQIISISNNALGDFVNIQFPTYFLEDGIDSFYIHCKIGTCTCDIECPTSPPSWTTAANISSIGPITRPTSSNNNGGNSGGSPDNTITNVVVVEEELSVYLYISAVVLALIIFAFFSLVTYICYDTRRRTGSWKPSDRDGTGQSRVIIPGLPFDLPRRPPPPAYESYVTQMERVNWREPPPTPPPPFRPSHNAPPSLIPPPFDPEQYAAARRGPTSNNTSSAPVFVLPVHPNPSPPPNYQEDTPTPTTEVESV